MEAGNDDGHVEQVDHERFTFVRMPMVVEFISIQDLER